MIKKMGRFAAKSLRHGRRDDGDCGCSSIAIGSWEAAWEGIGRLARQGFAGGLVLRVTDSLKSLVGSLIFF